MNLLNKQEQDEVSGGNVGNMIRSDATSHHPLWPQNLLPGCIGLINRWNSPRPF